jgi:hypothetical protein
MELLDQYLTSVRSCLPAAQRDDIVSELSENLRAQIEDKEGELGRPLNEGEVEAILKQLGHPLVVASRYRQDQRSVAFGQQIIGPVLFPFYIRVLSFNLGLTGVVILVVLTALFASGKSVTLVSTLPTFLYQFLIQFGVITLIFALAERHWNKFPDRWDPRGLKYPWHPAFAIQTGSKSEFSSAQESPRISRFDSIAQFVALGISIGWLRVAQRFPFMIFGPAAAFIKPAPIWHQFYWPVVLLALAGMVQAGVSLVRPDWVRLPVIYRLVSNVVWITMLLFLLKAGSWIVLTDIPGTSAESYRRTVEVLNHSLIYALIGLSVVTAYDMFRHLRRLFRDQDNQAPSTTAMHDR